MSIEQIIGDIVLPCVSFVLLIVVIVFYVLSLRTERDRYICKTLGMLCLIGNCPIRMQWVVAFFDMSRKEFLRLYDRLENQLFYHNSIFDPDTLDSWGKEQCLDLLFPDDKKEG